MNDNSNAKIKIPDQYRKCFADTPVGTILTRQEIIEQMGKLFGTNPNSIIPSDYCYNMTNKGKTDDFPNFFMRVDTGKYRYVGENYSFENINNIIDSYKADFEQIHRDEIYKWKAVQWYKEHWNIEAPDFAAMIAESFSKAGNLLAGPMYWPYRMICGYAQKHPEEVRELFRMLYDEQKPLAKRYVAFKNSCDDFIAEFTEEEKDRTKPFNHYQDLHAISVYLSFEYPETYYIYKFKIYKNFRDLIGFAEQKGKNKSEVWKLENYTRMCDLILDVVRNDSELQKMHKSRLGEDCYNDEACHLLVMDIIHFGLSYKASSKPIMNEEYRSPLDVYNPNISEKQWELVLSDNEIATPETMRMLKMMLELGGESTCSNLAEQYGGVHTNYYRIGTTFGRRVKNKLNCPDCIDEGTARYFPIPFIGRYVLENGVKKYSWKLRTELKEALENMDLSGINISLDKKPVTDVFKNIILYGPPGTGKTYNTVLYAVAIIENRPLASVIAEPYEDVISRYNEYKAAGYIEFTTFHQSYGYEDFIEGIKPTMDTDSDERSEIEYEITPGLFKRFCEKASQPVLKKAEQDIGLNASPTVWKVSLEGTGDNPTRTECMMNNHIRVGYDSYGENITSETEFTNGGKNVLNALIYKMKKGDVVLSCYSSSMIDAVGVVTGDYEWHDEYEHLKRVRNVKWLVKGIREDITSANGSTMTLSTVYRMNISLSDVMEIVSKYSAEKDEVQENENNYVFIIDEINRGNISKIFGELITLIEPSKRIGQTEGMTAILPYSKKPFGVPDNIFLIGTMNTADRSIATIDTALRRRFRFKEIQPNPAILEGISVEDISIKEMLTRMNQKISVLYDRDHTIGHAYFIPLRMNPTIETLGAIFENSIIPLLQEYFYDDYEKIRLILGDKNKSEIDEQFIIAKPMNYAELFGDSDLDIEDRFNYEINPAAFNNIEAYRYI